MAQTNVTQTVEQERGEVRPCGEREGGAAPDPADEPCIVEEICVEELAIDGICGVY